MPQARPRKPSIDDIPMPQTRSRKPSGSEGQLSINQSRERKLDETSSRSRQPDVTEAVKSIDLNPTSPTRSDRSSAHSSSGNRKRSKSRARNEATSSSTNVSGPVSAINIVIDENV
jgi:hypothetical protein